MEQPKKQTASPQTEPSPSAELLEIFPWNEQLNTGIAIIDDQHRKLVEILNRLARQHMLGVEETEIQCILHELAEYAEYHFSTEEAIWGDFLASDEWLSEHEQAHQAFFAKIQAIGQSDEPFEQLLEQLFSFLIQWLAFHIIDSDKRMAKAVAAREQGCDIEAAKRRANEEMSGSTSVLIQTVLSMYDHLSSQAIELIREKHARVQIEAALSDSEARWHLLREGSEDLLWEWSPGEADTDHKLPPDLAMEGWQLPEDALARLRAAMVALVETPQGDSLQQRYPLRHASGALRWMSLRCRVVQRDASGRAKKLVGTRSDASRSELAELIYQHGNDAMMVTDGDNRIISVNPAFEALTGYREEAILGADPGIFGSERNSAEIFRQMKHGLEETQSWQGELWNRHRDGHDYVAAMSIRRLNLPDGRPRMYVVIAKDRTEHTRARLAMEQQHQMLENALDAIDAGSWRWDVLTGELSINERWASMLGYRMETLQPVNIEGFYALIHPQDRALVKRQLEAHLLDPGKQYRCEIRLQHRDGHWVWVLTQGRVMEYNAEGEPWKMFGVHVDISEQKGHAEHLEYVSLHDVLTGLPNRTLFDEELEREMAKVRRQGGRLALVYLDVDDFAELNQRHGRELGDRLLVMLSQTLRRGQRESNLLARVGGDEFVLVMLDLDEGDDYLHAIERLHHQLAEQQWSDGVALPISVSMGISLYPQDEPVDAEQLLRQADQAMYQAKQLGKRRYHIFDTQADLSIRQHHKSLERIREALALGEFVLHYQPKVNMHSGELLSLEALIRWQHPERGLLAPMEFIPLIEQHPLAIAVGDWVIEEALRQLALWNARGLKLAVSVNIAGPQLQDSGFLARLKRQLAAQPEVMAEQLELEILETAALEDMGHVAELIEHCRAIDIQFALDDFGTGYSSLNYLKQLAAQTVKIDQSFVRHMLGDAEHVAIIHSIVGLANTFNRHPLAEGVESEAHGKLLLQLGCVHGQGYGIARPMPADKLPEWLAKWRPPASWKDCKRVAYEHIPVLFAEVEYRSWFNLLGKPGYGDEAPAVDPRARFRRLQQWLGSPATQDSYGSTSAFVELKARIRQLEADARAYLSTEPGVERGGEPLPEPLASLHRQVLAGFVALRGGGG